MKNKYMKFMKLGFWGIATGFVISLALIPVAIVYSVASVMTMIMGSMLGMILGLTMFVLYIMAILTVAGYVITKFKWSRKK